MLKCRLNRATALSLKECVTACLPAVLSLNNRVFLWTSKKEPSPPHHWINYSIWQQSQTLRLEKLKTLKRLLREKVVELVRTEWSLFFHNIFSLVSSTLVLFFSSKSDGYIYSNKTNLFVCLTKWLTSLENKRKIQPGFMKLLIATVISTADILIRCY